jgi:hypothetical protein
MSVPKVEVENPSTLDICEHLLPAIKDWEIGKKYFVKLEVEVASLNQGGMYNPNDSKEVRASFRVLGAQSLEAEESPKVEENNGKNNSKEAFVRAVVKAANDYTEN